MAQPKRSTDDPPRVAAPSDMEVVALEDGTLLVSYTARPGAKGGAAVGKLTPAERAVAALALAGLENAAIARARKSSVRTVANLLARCFRKLGVRSRTELAALVQGTKAG